MSIAAKLQLVAEDYVEKSEAKEAIRQAIIAKEVDVPESTLLADFPPFIAAISSGGGPPVESFRVRFVDPWDGTILKTQIVNSGNNATAPAYPIHPNLTCVGWVNSFTNITRNTDIGANYVSSDGKTRFALTITPVIGTNMTLNLKKTTVDGLAVAWGDGEVSASSATGNVTFQHTYASYGNYTATIECAGGYSLGQGGAGSPFIASTYMQEITSIIIGSTCTGLESYAFASAYSLLRAIIPSTIQTIGISVFQSCRSLSSVVIPTITTIGTSMFNSCFSLESAVLPSEIIALGDSVFSSCSALSFINMPSNLQTIGASTFNGCSSLQDVILVNGLISIGASAFYGCNLISSIIIPDTVLSIGGSAFNNCKGLVSIRFSNSMTVLEDNICGYCTVLQDVVLPIGLVTIKNSCFQSTAVRNIIFPATLTSTGTYLFNSNSALISVVFLNGITALMANALNGCTSLKSILLPTSLTTIGDSAIYNCFSLESITIPATVTNIAAYGLGGLYSASEIVFLSAIPPAFAAANSLSGLKKTTKIYVPDANIDTYKTATNYSAWAAYMYPLSTRP